MLENLSLQKSKNYSEPFSDGAINSLRCHDFEYLLSLESREYLGILVQLLQHWRKALLKCLGMPGDLPRKQEMTEQMKLHSLPSVLGTKHLPACRYLGVMNPLRLTSVYLCILERRPHLYMLLFVLYPCQLYYLYQTN